jgi:hypothetical protein
LISGPEDDLVPSQDLIPQAEGHGFSRHACTGSLFADLDEVVVQFAVEPVGLVNLQPDLGPNGFVNPGGAEHEMGADLLEVLHGRFHRFGKIDGDSRGHCHAKGVHLLSDPGKGQERDIFVGIRQRVGIGELQPHADEIFVRQHGSLGQACGTGGEAQVADVIGFALTEQGFEQVGVFGHGPCHPA